MLVYPILILNIYSTNIFFRLGKMIGMVQSWTSFILSSQSWEIGSSPTGSAGRMKLSCVVPTSIIFIWPIYTSWRRNQCEHCQFATVWWNAIILLKKKIYMFDKRNVEESFRYHPTLILFYCKIHCDNIFVWNRHRGQLESRQCL